MMTTIILNLTQHAASAEQRVEQVAVRYRRPAASQLPSESTRGRAWNTSRACSSRRAGHRLPSESTRGSAWNLALCPSCWAGCLQAEPARDKAWNAGSRIL